MTNKRRIVLKLSGEALAGEQKTGLDNTMLKEIACEIKKLIEADIQVGIVVGGGNFWRGRNEEAESIDKTTANHIGMLATVMNGLAISDALRSVGLETVVQSSIDMSPIAKGFVKDEAIKHLQEDKIVIFVCGTGNPFFTTDTAIVLRATEIEADTVLLAKSVDAVYSSDPLIDKNAVKYNEISYTELLHKDIKVIDSTAITFARDNNLTCHLFSLAEPANISKALFGTEQFGTIIREK